MPNDENHPPKDAIQYVGRTFHKETVDLDRKVFVNCELFVVLSDSVVEGLGLEDSFGRTNVNGNSTGRQFAPYISYDSWANAIRPYCEHGFPSSLASTRN